MKNTPAIAEHTAFRSGKVARIDVIDVLRAIAALAVCWFHFTHGVGEFLPEGPLKASGKYGFLGVPVFFAISGFVIPYTLSRSSYDIGNYARFVAKRVIRLDPPYFVSLAMALVVGFALMKLTNYKRGILPYESWQQVLFHAGYLNGLLGYKWLNPVYWSLAIEFQYYLILGLVFPVLFGSGKRAFLLSTALCCVIAVYVPNPNLVFWYLPWFCFGIVACQYEIKRILFHEHVLVTACLVIYTTIFQGAIYAVVLLGSSVIISFVRIPTGKIFGGLGALSYSLYLTHPIIGVTIINLSKHYRPSYFLQCVTLACAFALTLCLSYIMYRYIEKPSLSIAGRINYKIG